MAYFTTRPRRERKKPEVFGEVYEKEEEAREEKRVLAVPDGEGVQLGDVPIHFGSLTQNSPLVRKLFRVLYPGQTIKQREMFRNIKQFCGWDEEEIPEKSEEILESCSVATCKTFINILRLSTDGLKLKEDYTNAILQFLKKPNESDEPIQPISRDGATRKKKRKSKPAKKKKTSSKGKKRKREETDDEDSEDSESSESEDEPKTKIYIPSPYIIFCKEMRSEVVSENPEMDFIEVTREIGKRWRELSDEDKEEFEQKRDEMVEDSKENPEKYMKKVKKRRKKAKESPKKKSRTTIKKKKKKSEKPKKKKKKATPKKKGKKTAKKKSSKKKTPAKKKKKEIVESSDSEEEELSTEEKLKDAIQDIVNHNSEFTMRFVKETLTAKFGKKTVKGNKGYIKETVKELIAA